MTWKGKKKKLSDEIEKPEVNEEEPKTSLEDLFSTIGGSDGEHMRSMGLYGDVDEEKASEVVGALLALRHASVNATYPEDITEEEIKEKSTIELYISTYGGSSDEMNSLYDIISMVKHDCPIRTVGLGKVMSAGVLLLASGTKGERYIGRNCRVMIHSVSAGHAGLLHNLENELEEVRKLQDLYIENLIIETNLTKKQMKTWLRRKHNVYLSAEEAIKYGIADKILEKL